MPKTNLQQQILIDALPTKVWKVLTSPAYISQYLLNGTIHCHCTEGSAITLINDEEGNEVIIHKGTILQVMPGILLKYNWQNDHSPNLTVVTYQLIPSKEGIELKYCCEGFADSDEEYFLRLQQTQLLLQKIKWLAEYA
jgi:uncharacterized protein YndB with AHSA1/START domain